ncbi:MAG: lipid A biosynthesis acyltransferase [Verrucomicrobia bacterium]|nr:lipid A biosynthesis acyltransferase [Verrucomicrobiota bacterium]
MSGPDEKHPKRWKWRMERLFQAGLEHALGWLPGPVVFRLGELLGGITWQVLPQRRKTVLRNLRIAFCGEHDPPALRRMAQATFRRTGANLFSAARTARLAPDQLGSVIHIENLELLEHALAGGNGVVLLLSHMGNWELLSRIVHLFPQGSRAGAFYRPLNNPMLDEAVLTRRQADGTRMFSKRDNPHLVARFLREGGIVGILADQRVGPQGEMVRFFGRLTRASPLPSLLARRAKSSVLALSLTTVAPGRWSARFVPVGRSRSTAECMLTLEQAMKASPVDVFWFQERWKVYLDRNHTIRDWLGPESHGSGRPHRALLWLADAPCAWRLPEAWLHPDVNYEAVLETGAELPPWLPASTRVHFAPPGAARKVLRKLLAAMDAAAALPVDFIVTSAAPQALLQASEGEDLPLVSLPPPP